MIQANIFISHQNGLTLMFACDAVQLSVSQIESTTVETVEMSLMGNALPSQYRYHIWA